MNSDEISFACAQPNAIRGFDMPEEGTMEVRGMADDDKVILVVDDESAILNLISDILFDHGFVLITVLNAKDALKILDDVEHGRRTDVDHIDLIVSDISMPVMSGIELIEIARRVYPSVRRGFITGYSQPSEIRDRTPTLQKPFKADKFIQFVEELLFGMPV